MFRDRRVQPRVVVEIPALYLLKGAASWQEGLLRDVSSTGAALLSEARLAQGTELSRLRFSLPDDGRVDRGEIDVTAKVVRKLPWPPGEESSGFLYGLEYLDLEDAEWQDIQNYVIRSLIAEIGTRSRRQAPAGKRRVPVEQPLVLRFERFQQFVDEVVQNISLEGMFIRARNPRPPGSEVEFEFQLGDDFTLVEGKGEVMWTRGANEGPDRPAGMGVRFLELDRTGKRVIERLVHEHADGRRHAAEEDDSEPVEKPG